MDTDPISRLLNIIGVSMVFSIEDGIISLSIIILLFCSALVAGSEVAFFSLNSSHLEDFRDSKSRREKKIYALLQKPKELIATMLIVNNFINIAIVILLAILAEKYLLEYYHLPNWAVFTIETVATTLIIIFIAEVTPKVYASQRSVGFAKNTVFILEYAQKVFKPFVTLMVKGTYQLEKLKNKKKQQHIDAEELIHAINLTSDSDTPIEEKKILKGIVNFGSIVARQIMTPRSNIVALPIDASFNQVIQCIRENRYSRIPIYKDKDRLEDVQGIIYVKDMLPFLNESDSFEWQKLMRIPFFIPETKKIDALLNAFKRKHIHFAVVVDEYGVTVGIVTMEDVIEEIVGEIHDEADEVTLLYTKVNETTYLFNAQTGITDFCKVLNIDIEYFDDAKGDSETLGGMIVEEHGKMPAKNHQYIFRDFKFIVEGVSKKRLLRIKVIILQTLAQSSAN